MCYVYIEYFWSHKENYVFTHLKICHIKFDIYISLLIKPLVFIQAFFFSFFFDLA